MGDGHGATRGEGADRVVEGTGLVSAAETRRAYVELLAEYLGTRLELDPACILGRDRESDPARARMLIMYWLRRQGWSLPAIAEAVERDHSTVNYACNAMPRRLATDPDLADLLRHMPAPSVRVFTEPSLVELYDRLTRALAEATYYGEQIKERMESERVPQRVSREQFERRIAGWEATA